MSSITTAADLDRLIPQQSDSRVVSDDAPPPYDFGDLVAVQVTDFVTLESTWVPGTVLKCDRPAYSRRFVARVAIGNAGPCPVTIERVYCWEDGTGDVIARLDDERPGEHLKRLNAPIDLLDLAAS